MSKRRRFNTRAARPVDKLLKTVQLSVIATQVSTQLLDITFPATVAGLRWSLSYNHILTTSDANLLWAIVVVRDGETVNSMSASDGANFYTPEQNVLAFGALRPTRTDAGQATYTWEGNTKTMRKLAVGDELHLIVDGSSAAQGTFLGVVQFFTKS